jgi:peptide/nickel transport system substrate-binding protein
MAHGMTRREFAAAAGAAGVAAYAFGARAESADTRTLRFIMRNDLRVLDPMWTTAYVSRNHGYMVFDTLFALDAKLRPHPQMVADYSVSADRLTYQFSLRDGLEFHDGQPARGIDCVASLKRWMARDSLGQTLATVTGLMTADGAKFTIRLKEPFPLLLAGLAKVSSLVPFIMPERIALTDPFKQITETIGSGPFKFVHDEFQPGHKVVYVKNVDYVPRTEPPSWVSRGKVAKVDRVEWLYMPEESTAAAALGNGEAD